MLLKCEFNTSTKLHRDGEKFEYSFTIYSKQDAAVYDVYRKVNVELPSDTEL
jgi:hypothetical protein